MVKYLPERDRQSRYERIVDGIYTALVEEDEQLENLMKWFADRYLTGTQYVEAQLEAIERCLDDGYVDIWIPDQGVIDAALALASKEDALNAVFPLGSDE
jgi:hypothetical protein